MRQTRLGLVGLVLLLSGVQLPARSSDSRLADAARSRDIAAVTRLLNEGVPVTGTQSDGATALHWAAHWDDVALAQLLISGHAKVDAVNDYGVTPLMLACTNGGVAMVERLLKAGADPKHALPSGETPLMTAARTGVPAVAAALLDAGADVNAAEEAKGQTALMWAAAERHLEVARVLLGRGAKVGARSKSGFTALLFAVRQDDLALTKLLLGAGANINETASDGSAPLLLATVLGHLPLAEYLLGEGADPNRMDAGFAPIHWASGEWGSVMIIQYQNTPLGEHLFGLPKARRVSFIKNLLAHDANPNLRITKEPPRYGGSIMPRRLIIGGTPFFFAAMAGDVDVMRILVGAGADPAAATDTMVTPLMAAAGLLRQENESVVPESDSVEAVKLALQMGVSVNAVDNEGDTAMHAIAFSGFNAAVQILVDAGADLHVRNMHGHTPYGVAEGGRCCSQVPMLIFRKEKTAALLRQVGGVSQ